MKTFGPKSLVPVLLASVLFCSAGFATWQFGSINGQGNFKLTIPDINGVPVIFNLSGGGWGDVNGPNFAQINLHGTTVNSKLTISTIGRGTRTSVGDVNVAGSLNSISAKTTDLRGNITIGGTIGGIQFDDVNNCRIKTIGTSSDPNFGTLMRFDRVNNLAIDSGAPIKLLTAAEWLGSDANTSSIVAPSLGTLQITGDRKRAIAGDFEAVVTLNGGTLQAGAAMVNTRIAGNVSGSTWDIAGKVRTVKIIGDANEWQLSIAGDLNALRLRNIINSNINITGSLSLLQAADCDLFSSKWQPLGGGTAGPVYALAIYNSQIIGGGNFTAAGGAAANYIALWNGSNWQPLGEGMDGAVLALAVNNGQLIAGGGFTTADGNIVNYVAEWDGSSWQSLGDGLGDEVSALAVYNGRIIAGGRFTTTADGNDVNSIAQWDGSSWQPLGKGMNNDVNALTVYNGRLIAGGSFTVASGIDANYIASWNGSKWQNIGSGMNGTVNVLTVYNGQLVAGGEFTKAGGADANYIAALNGNNWGAIGSGTNNIVDALTVYNSQLIAGGSFDDAGGTSANRIAEWNGSSWQGFGSGMDGNSANVYALAVNNGKLIAGGDFGTAGGADVNNIARWSSGGMIVDANVGSMRLKSLNGTLTIGGNARSISISEQMAVSAPDPCNPTGVLTVSGKATVKSPKSTIKFTNGTLYTSEPNMYRLEDLRGYGVVENSGTKQWKYTSSYKITGSAGSNSGVVYSEVDNYSFPVPDPCYEVDSLQGGSINYSALSTFWYNDTNGTHLTALTQETPLGLLTLATDVNVLPGEFLRLGQKNRDSGTFSGQWDVNDNSQVIKNVHGITGTVKTTCRLIDNEQVVVPTGTYLAAKIAISVVMAGTSLATIGSNDYPGKFTANQTQTLWCVPGVGIVKSVESTSAASRAGGKSISFKITATNLLTQGP